MSYSATPLISLIIPTRERAETLSFALQTALDHACNSYEVIVSDNFSQDNTEEVVRTFDDPRLKYFNTGKRLSMSDNWEFALGKARGEYMIFIGDDDAVMPGGIDKLEALIEEYQSDTYIWGSSIYAWPIDDKNAMIRYLAPVQPIHEMSLQKMASFVMAHGGWRYYRIPGTYHAAVSVKILDLIRKQTGRVFHTTQPDIFTSMAVPAYARTCINTGHAITVIGFSAKSNGGASVARNGVAVQSKYIREYGNYQIHPTLSPEAPIMPNLIGDAFLVAMDKFPEFYGKMKFNYEAMWAFMWLNKLISFREIIKERSNISQYRTFSTPAFLFHMAIQSVVSLRRHVINRLAEPEHSNLDIPDNIRDFASLLSKIQK